MIAPLPEATRRLLVHNTHPGLLLDKYVESWEEGTPPGRLSERIQKPAVRAIVSLSQRPPDGLDWADLRARRDAFLAGASATCSVCETVGPLTLHLARAGALENAGICLHRVYGFAYLPGSGLKGLARAYAETVAKASKEDILAVFGNEPGEPNTKQRAGGIVFHDAWPLVWPRLIEDILNNHHRDYYSKTDNASAPGDWEEPNMVSFLAVPAGVKFDFPLGKRRSDVSDETLANAKRWLTGGLTVLGAGAKTAAGYGDFRVVGSTAPHWPASVSMCETSLELVTPAFLAGPSQSADDCELRPATLRGLLRWWWRTLHAGYVDVITLRRLESAVWGSTQQGGAVRLTNEPAGLITPFPYDKTWIAKQNQLPAPPDRKTTQGLFYHSYGMDESKGRRAFVPTGTKWMLRLSARDSRIALPSADKGAPKHSLPAELVLAQARAALWLLCRYGGVGSKSRKGFGSFRDPAELNGVDLTTCEKEAERFRAECGLPRLTFDPRKTQTPTWKQMLPFVDIPTQWKNCWWALDQVGDVVQRFAQSRKHDVSKKALGLPRKVTPGTFRPGPGPAKSDRHASPVLFHLSAETTGFLTVRVAAFPAPQLPNIEASRSLLTALLDHLRAELPLRVSQHANKGQGSPNYPPAKGGGAGGDSTTKLPNNGDTVSVVIAADPKAKGRLFAKHSSCSLPGPITNAGEVPEASRGIGTEVTLVIASISTDGKQIAFRWPQKPKA